MLYSALEQSVKGLISESQIKMLYDYFNSLLGEASNCITVSKVAAALNISADAVFRILKNCESSGILTVSYAIRCPDCGLLLQRYSAFADISEHKTCCYNCDTQFIVTFEDVESVYSTLN